MSLIRRNPRRDANEVDIVRALEACGVRVWRQSATGLPDLLCRLGRLYFLVDAKGRRGTLTPAQQEFFQDAWHHRAPALVIRDPEAVPAMLNDMLSMGGGNRDCTDNVRGLYTSARGNSGRHNSDGKHFALSKRTPLPPPAK